MNIRTLLTTATIALILATPAVATIWRVDNNPGAVNADFSTLQDANDDLSVLDGDTLYVAGSVSSYGSLTLAKQLFIIGPGYFLAENPDVQDNQLVAKVNHITFASGSEGSLITGLSLSDWFQVDVGSITIKRNVTPIIIIAQNISNITITQNYILKGHTNAAISIGANTADVTIKNNYLQSGFTYSDNLNFSSTATNIIVEHNVIYGLLLIYNTSFQNNILRAGDTVTGSNNSFFNNIGNADQFGTANGNQANVDMATVFVGADSGSTDGQWQIKAGGPADGSGLNGVDIGMFGGITPYVLSGIPAIPSIYSLVVPGSGTEAGGLQVRVKARGNN